MRFEPPAYEDIPTVADLVAAADERVSGLDAAKRRLALTLRRFMVAAVKDRPRPKQNVVVLGQTGGGKTFLVTEMLKACPVVWTEANATEYSDVGYMGRDLTSMYLGLTSPRWRGRRGEEQWRVNEMTAFAERWGVVVIDEWDKLRTNRVNVPGERQVGRVLQAEMLKLVEGSEALVKHGDSDHGTLLRTHNILHIAVGAFSGLARIVKRAEELPDDITDGKAIERVKPGDLIEYGFLEELVGRFSTLLPLPSLDGGHLARIFREHVVPDFQQQCGDDGIELLVDESAVAQMGNYAIGSNIGARALGSKLDDCLADAWSRAQPGDRIVLDARGVMANAARIEHREAA